MSQDGTFDSPGFPPEEGRGEGEGELAVLSPWYQSINMLFLRLSHQGDIRQTNKQTKRKERKSTRSLREMLYINY